MIRVTVNGGLRQLEEPVTIAAFLEQRNLHQRMVVVEHNLAIVPRDQYAELELQDGDVLEVVQMMAGG